MDEKELMRRAINSARAGIEAGQSPFGCAIASEGRVIACQHNTVLATPDCTAHAEINALREACQRTGQVHLNGAIVATTCEPCPMCIAALHWARVTVVYFGAAIGDARQAGFNELQLPAHDVLRRGGSCVEVIGNILPDECRQLFQQWLQRDGHQSY
ncbi:MAG: nucleoside deaminase [Planctomycetota bacterium]